MDVKELKTKIEKNEEFTFPLILKYSDNKFLAMQYARAICKNINANVNVIYKLSDMSNDELFDDIISDIYIFDIEKLDTKISSDCNNLIIICKEIKEEQSIDFIEMPKLINWQIEDFLKMRMNGLTEDQIKWLCEIANYDIYRLDNECKKIEMFSPQMQSIVFNAMCNDGNFSDLTPLTIFNFTNALLKRDYNVMRTVLSDLETVDVEGSALPVILIRNFKNMIDIKLNPKNTAETLGMQLKQFNAIRWTANNFSPSQLINIFEFLTEIDYRLKAGELTFEDGANHLTNNNHLVDYISCNLINLMNR